MRPSKSVQDMEVKSLKKKFKDKHFAAGCSRDVIQQGADLLGWDLNNFLNRASWPCGPVKKAYGKPWKRKKERPEG